MKIELFTITVEELLHKAIDIHNEVYEAFNEDVTVLETLYDEYVKYTRDYSTGSCLFKESFLKKLPNADKIMHYITINYDSLILKQEDKYITVYVNVNINLDLFKSL